MASLSNIEGTTSYPSPNRAFTIRKPGDTESTKISGTTDMMQYNDRGGSTDDKDYDDAFVAINDSIGPSASGESLVTLVQYFFLSLEHGRRKKK